MKDYQMSAEEDGEKEEGDDTADSSYQAVCLITGKKGHVRRLHTSTPIAGSKSIAKIVAFQKNSGFDSFLKEQAFNAPVSPEAEAAYSTALKHLIKSEQNRILISDTTVLFWAQKRQEEGFDLESAFSLFLRTDRDDTERGVKAVQSLYRSLDTGRLPIDEDNLFYVLGLAPNTSRISIRFWKSGTVGQFAEKIKSHFDDFAIVHGPKDHEYLALARILSAVAFENRLDKVPPNLPTALIVSVLDGTPYPKTLMQQCMRRIRAEQKITRDRAAILKAYVNRFNRFYNTTKKEVHEMLDTENREVGYLLGRLFAVLERVQEQSAGGEGKLNSTIRNRFWGTFSTSPRTVIPILLKLKNHHVAKLESGGKVYFESLIGNIMDGLDAEEIPAHLTLGQQSYLAVGYYQQRQAFFKKKESA